jgi:anti-sigma regulatory factor (Ser/Thr protein kinase)
MDTHRHARTNRPLRSGQSGTIPAGDTIPRTTQRFEATVSQVSAARQFVATTVAAWGLAPDDAGLVATELATNALVHARSPFAVSVDYQPPRLVVEVTDDGPWESPSSVIKGKGLAVVEHLSTWGVRRHMNGGKTVWAALTVVQQPDESRTVST